MLPTQTRIFVYAQPVDMRRSFDALGQCVRDVLQQEPVIGKVLNAICVGSTGAATRLIKSAGAFQRLV
jgi:hypothetical protein